VRDSARLFALSIEAASIEAAREEVVAMREGLRTEHLADAHWHLLAALAQLRTVALESREMEAILDANLVTHQLRHLINLARHLHVQRQEAETVPAGRSN
jgi:hypothetical protein